MRGKKLLSAMLSLGSCCLTTAAFAFSPFTVKAIRIVGLQGINQQTVMNYVPVRIGREITPENSSQIIQALYNTGFFQDVELGREGNTLYIYVSERPVISSITISGNKDIKSDDLRKVLRKMGIAEGQVLNRSAIANLKFALQNQYTQLSKYNASVDITTKRLARNRVDLTIAINEGGVTKVGAILISGNQAFSQRTLLHQFKLSTPNLFSFFTKDDEYTEEKLDDDLQNLKYYYLDHGYLRMQIVSHQVSLSADKQQVTIHVQVEEGPQYRFSGYHVSGDIPISQEELLANVDLTPNTIFSREKIVEAQKAMGHALGNHGYAFAQIAVEPVVNENAKTVAINYEIMPGRRYYVRQIHFSGNTKTEDKALRQVMQQMEGGLVNLKRIDDSTRNLNLLGFVKDVHHDFTPVAGKDNQVDLNMHVSEMPSATITAGVGYSTDQKFLVSASFNQPNFLGTGDAFGINFSNSAYVRSYSVSFTNPYFTPDGISQSLSFYYQRYNPGKLSSLTNSYTYNAFGGNLGYGIPINNYNRFTFGAGFEHIKLLPGNPEPLFITEFLNRQNGKTRYNQASLSVGWIFNSFDRAFFPTKGLEADVNASVALPASSRSLHYYKLNANTQGFLPLDRERNWIVMGKGGAVYGNGFNNTQILPFFTNYFGGGLDTDVPLPSLEANSLGPKDEFGNTMGGNVGYFGQMGLIVPQFNENVRTLLFVQGSKLYATKTSPTYTVLQELAQARKPRYAYGVSVEWRTFFAPIVFSLSKPIKRYCQSPGSVTVNGITVDRQAYCDDPDVFQFTLAANF
ncbi:MAG: outer membrane protein assembly factor BamA [Legionellales bacterium]|nr:outer membrane protein assembly factor BamA [Legionellales bacterium]